jgi:hypothetical protein
MGEILNLSLCLDLEVYRIILEWILDREVLKV